MNTSSAKDKVILVTGGNRGVGLEICRQLANRGATVILTARNSDSGKAAMTSLGRKAANVKFHQLDVTDPNGVAALRKFVEDTYERLDVLINNAAIIGADDGSALKVELNTVRQTFETNTLAPLRLSQSLSHLLKRGNNGRIVNMSSGMGQLSSMEGGYAAYRISKAALNAVTGILAAELRGIVAVNSMCPGWVRTDMGSANADRDVSQGAETAVWLALDAPQELTGKFLRDHLPIPW